MPKISQRWLVLVPGLLAAHLFLLLTLRSSLISVFRERVSALTQMPKVAASVWMLRHSVSA